MTDAVKPLAHGHRGDWYLMANARRIALQPIAEVRRQSNWNFACALFATGSTSAHQICIDAGIDPDGTEVLHGTQPTPRPEPAPPLVVPAGWAFNAADFSCIAAGQPKQGNVTLVRDVEHRRYWHMLPDAHREADDGPPLYVCGHGMTLNEAMQDAINKALAARPIQL